MEIRGLRLPPAAVFPESAALDEHEASALELPEVFKKSVWPERLQIEDEIFKDHALVNLERNEPGAEEGRNLRSEDEKARLFQMVIKRFDAEPVAGAEQEVRSKVVKTEGPHPVEFIKAVATPFLIGLQDYFRIRLSSEFVAEVFQLFAELDIIINFAVIGDPLGSVIIGHRLMAFLRKLDDTQSPVAQGKIMAPRRLDPRLPAILDFDRFSAIGVEQDRSGVIGSPVSLTVVHRLDQACQMNGPGGVIDSADAAHQTFDFRTKMARFFNS
jgi:hypothetical protein